jgi:O-acetylhomoserine/O-acetylserine sulfhydrylase-like pyridoxal-dependent enzyme
MLAFMDQAGEPKWIEGDMNSILGMIIENGTNILIKHNDHIFKLSSQKQDDLEIAYQRVANISKVRSKKRNVYRQVRDGVLTVAKTDRASS